MKKTPKRHIITLAFFCYMFCSCSFPIWFINFSTEEQPRLRDQNHHHVLDLSGYGIGMDMSKRAMLEQLNFFSGKPLLDIRKVMITHQGNPVSFKVETYNEVGKRKRVKSTMILPEHHLLHLYLKTPSKMKDGDEICITEADFPHQGDTLSFKAIYKSQNRSQYLYPYHRINKVVCNDDEGNPVAEISLQFTHKPNLFRLYARGVATKNEYTHIPIKRVESIEKALRKKDKDVIYMIQDQFRFELSSTDLRLYDYESFCRGIDSQAGLHVFQSVFLILPEKKRELNKDDQLVIMPGDLLIYHGKPVITKPIRLSLYPKHEGEK